MMTNLKKSKKGFTLVELIVVIAILAIIAAVAIPTTISYIAEAERTTAESDANSVIQRIEEAVTLDRDITPEEIKAVLDKQGYGENIVSVTIASNVITVTTNVEAETDGMITATKTIADVTLPDCTLTNASGTWTVGE